MPIPLILHKFWLCIVVGWMSCSMAFGQIETRLQPENIFIGDTASLQITITVDSRQTVELPQLGDSLTPYLEISHIKTDSMQRGHNLNIVQNITLTGFEPGTFLVKALPIKIDGEVYLSRSASLHIKDVVVDEDKQGLFPIKPIMQQQITWWEKYKQYIYYMVAGLLLVLVLLLIIWMYFREKKKNKYISKPLLPAYEEAIENLKKLDDENWLAQEKYYEYYSDLSFILRRYFERRFNFAVMPLLSDDLALVMQQKEYLTPKESTALSNFLEDADFTKYARKIPAAEKHLFYRKWVEEIIYTTRPLLEDHLPAHIPSAEETENLRKLDQQ